jgi:hypothetical protein
MRKPVLAAFLAGLMNSAAAGGPAWADVPHADGNDYSARALYRLDFGGGGERVHSLGLRFDNELAAAYGAPALFQAGFDSRSSVPSLRLQGLELAGPALAAAQDPGTGGFWSGFFANMQWYNYLTMLFTLTVFGTVVNEATQSSDQPAPVQGTGIGSGSGP